MTKRASTETPILDIVAERWSPRSFDPTFTVTAADLAAPFEAARWAPSANNRQPWSFIVGYRGDDTFATILETLKGYNPTWAPTASALIVACANTAGDKDTRNPWAEYDLGQSVAYFSLQAASNGLFVHQIGGFNTDAAAEKFGVESPWVPVTVIAVGKPGDPAALPEELAAREVAPRERKAVSDFVH
ncbi:MAG: nitroreductase family protein [Microbacteriaceae bacterium]